MSDDRWGDPRECGERDRDNGRPRVRANLVDVAVDVDGGLPGCAPVRRPGDTADVDVGEKHRAVRMAVIERIPSGGPTR
jgi:hypothetical protein